MRECIKTKAVCKFAKKNKNCSQVHPSHNGRTPGPRGGWVNPNTLMLYGLAGDKKFAPL